MFDDPRQDTISGEVVLNDPCSPSTPETNANKRRGVDYTPDSSSDMVCDAELTERLELERNNWKQVAREHINRNNESLLALCKATAELDTAQFNLNLSRTQHLECAKELAAHRDELAPLRLKAADRDEWQEVAMKVSKERDNLLADKKARAEINTSYRLFDLVRYQRAELHRSGLITNEEYGWLCASDMAISPQGGSPSRQRLEDYDKLRAELEAVKKEHDAFRTENEALKAQVSFHKNLGITLLDAKYLDPACHKGCQSLKHHNDLNASQQTIAVLRAALGISPEERIPEQKPTAGSLLVERGGTRARISPTSDEAIKLERTVAQLQEELDNHRQARNSLPDSK